MRLRSCGDVTILEPEEPEEELSMLPPIEDAGGEVIEVSRSTTTRVRDGAIWDETTRSWAKPKAVTMSLRFDSAEFDRYVAEIGDLFSSFEKPR